MRIFVLVAAALAVAAPAMGQTPEEKANKVTRAAKRLTQPDASIINEAAKQLKVGGECNTTFTVGLDGKPKDIKPNCNPPEYDEWVIKAMAPVTYTVELFAGEAFETEGMKQPFKMGNGPGSSMAPVESKPAVVTTPVDSRAIGKAIDRLKPKEEGSCAAAYVVGVDGKPKDIKPNCTLPQFDELVKTAIGNMVYAPATKGGTPVEINMTMNIPLKK